jgi:hypothetical protein
MILIKYLESKSTKHPATKCRTLAQIVAIDGKLVGYTATRDFPSYCINTPTNAFFRIALYLLKFASHIIATWHELERSIESKSTRAFQGCKCQMLASGQFGRDTSGTAFGHAATFSWLIPTVRIILTLRCV